MGFPFPIQAGGPHTQAAPSMSAVFTHPHGFPHTPEPFSHTFPRLPQSPYACADPHRFSQFPIRFRGSHIQSPSSKNLTLIPTRPAFLAPQTRHLPVSTNSLRRLPARCRMSWWGIKSAETSDRLAQIYAPDRLTQIHCANDEGGMGIRARHRFAMRRRQRRRCVGVDVRGGSTCVSPA